jgi:hypothetical protein
MGSKGNGVASINYTFERCSLEGRYRRGAAGPKESERFIGDRGIVLPLGVAWISGQP